MTRTIAQRELGNENAKVIDAVTAGGNLARRGLKLG